MRTWLRPVLGKTTMRARCSKGMNVTHYELVRQARLHDHVRQFSARATLGAPQHASEDAQALPRAKHRAPRHLRKREDDPKWPCYFATASRQKAVQTVRRMEAKGRGKSRRNSSLL